MSDPSKFIHRRATKRNQPVVFINPLDSRHIVGVEEATGKGGMPVVSCRISLDGGSSWRQSWPLLVEAEWVAIGGPVLAMDARGTLQLAVLAECRDRRRAQVAVYWSADGGIQWSRPSVVLEAPEECSYSLAADLGGSAASRGNVYLVTDAGGTLHFGRSRDGESWNPNLAASRPALWSGPCFSPQALIDSDGALHLAWLAGHSGRAILAMHSADGGESFGDPITVADGIVTYCDGLPDAVPAICFASSGVALCAWADNRDNRSRIYWRRSTDRGRTWLGPRGGEPLLDSELKQHQFQPRLLATDRGEICCSFYEYGPKTSGGRPLMDHVMAVSYDNGETFGSRMVLSDRSWDPMADEPLGRSAS